jgi:hypothetical protein
VVLGSRRGRAAQTDVVIFLVLLLNLRRHTAEAPRAVPGNLRICPDILRGFEGGENPAKSPAIQTKNNAVYPNNNTEITRDYACYSCGASSR